ncbi:MAG: dihydroorotate dehydrogenase [Dictyoglomus sp. NZ13-RE01]|nr:MAG: dihydroorotate dehydrogenase [Dictyoglomus sp. NZ13-RE01]
MDLSTNYVGLRLKNPIIVASSGLTENLKNMKKVEENGAGALVVKSLFEEEVCRVSPTPRFEIISRTMGPLRSQTLYSFEQASPFSPEEYFKEVSKALSILSIPVIPSINCITNEGWLKYSKMAQEINAPALELNVSCPHASISFRGQDVDDTIINTAKLVRENVDIPLIVKLPMQLSSPLAVAKELERIGINGIVMFNRLTGLDIDLEKEKPIMHGGYAGHGGPWALNYTLRWISTSSPHLNISISASGGVGSGDDIVKYIMVGADAVQVCSIIYLMGYEIISSLLNGVKRFMENKGYTSLEDFRGKVSGKAILGNYEIDRRHYLKAQIDENLCNACGICKKVCIYDAPIPKDGKYFITELCDGCGLCPKLCPQKAITMVKR